jgi:hypothetical protein
MIMGVFRRNIFIILAIAAVALFAAGCVYNAGYLVKNSKLSEVETVLKDYAGLSGYKMTYANDETGAYRIVVSSAIVPVGQVGMLQGEHERPPVERQVASLAVQMVQAGNDVSVNAQSTGSLDASDQFRAFIDYLQGKGYTVQEIKPPD